MPLQQGEGRIGVIVMFEHRCHESTYFNGRFRVTQQVAHNPRTLAVRKLDEHHNVGPLRFLRRMHRVPDPFVAVDACLTRDRFKSTIV